MKKMKIKNNLRQLGILLVMAAMAVVFSFGADSFLTWGNLISILQQTAIKGVLAVGMTIVIISGGIDLSVGSIVALSCLAAAKIMVAHGAGSIGAALAAALAVGLLCGLVNGALIAYCGVQPFLITMGTMNLFRGLEYIFSGAVSIRGLPTEFTIGMSSLNESVPIPVIILIVVVVIIALVMKYSKFGRYVFAVGGNEEATRLSGVNVKRIKLITYLIIGLAGAICAIIYLGRIASADANAGDGYELDAIAAAAIGGASLSGGKGSISGAVMGAFMLAMLSNGLTLLNVQAFYQVAATGLIIIIAVLIDRFSNK